jgi:hypothetical protein
MTFDEAVSYFGSAYRLARALGLNPQSIKGWDKQIPILRQYQIELATEGKLKADFPALVDIRYAPGFDPETTVTYVVAKKKAGSGETAESQEILEHQLNLDPRKLGLVADEA